MMSRWFVFAMAYLHFLPLWLIVIAMNVVETVTGRVSWQAPVMFGVYSVVLIAVISLVLVVVNLQGVPRSCSKFRRTLDSFHERKTEGLDFFLTFLLPIIGIDCKSGSGLIILAILFLIIASVYTRHFFWQTNIVLDWLGYSLYTCGISDVDNHMSEVLVLTKGTLEGCRNRELAFYKMNNRVYMVVTKETR